MTFALTPSDGSEKNVAAVTRQHFSVVFGKNNKFNGERGG